MYFLDGSVPTPEIAEKFIEVCEQERGCIAGIVSAYMCLCKYLHIYFRVRVSSKRVCVREREREREPGYAGREKERQSNRARERQSDKATE